MTDLISVIIPIYNAERYLEECLNSVLTQTYTNFELLLIDDGSEDNSAKLCKSYAKADTRVVYIHQENAGVCVARNRGLNVAQGDYISFVDADDLLCQSHLEQLYKSISNNNADLVCCGVNDIQHNGVITRSVAVDRDSTLSMAEAVEVFFRVKYYAGTVWAKLYRMSIIDKFDLRFDNRFKYAEDDLFSFKYLQRCNKISYLSNCLYQYRIDNIASAMNLAKSKKQFNTRQLYDVIEIYSEIIDYAENNFAPELYKLGRARYFDVCRLRMMSYLKYNCKDSDILSLLKFKMKTFLWSNLCYYNTNITRKFFNCMITFTPKLLKPLIKLI